MLRHLAFALAALIVAVVFSGCRDADVQIVMRGDLAIEGCGQFLPWSPEIAGFTVTDNQGVMRFFGDEGVPATLNDNFVLTITDMDAFRASLGTPFPVELSLDDQPASLASASLTYFAFCNDRDALPLLFEGTATFTSFSTERGRRISGTMEGEFRNGRRPHEVVGTGITVDFAFNYRINEPYQPFPPR